jgi:hypothetical protein
VADDACVRSHDWFFGGIRGELDIEENSGRGLTVFVPFCERRIGNPSYREMSATFGSTPTRCAAGFRIRSGCQRQPPCAYHRDSV